MLKSLEVRNFAIIDYIKLDFFQGMTVLTGETGAGKSIIVDAISLLLGERAQKEMIASKNDSAEIIGIFSIDSKEVKNILEENEIDYENDIEIYRLISKDNRNIVKINNQTSSLKIIKDLALYLADIHSQFDTNQLINPDNYLKLVDDFRKKRIQPLIDNYQEAYEHYYLDIKSYNDQIKKKDESLKKLDLYKFQLNEIKNLELDQDEYEEMVERINILENIDKINTSLEKGKFYLNDEFVIDRLYEIKNDFEDISKLSSEFEEMYNRINEVYYELDDINSQIVNRLDNLDFDRSDFDMMIERVNDINKIKQKYNMSLNELIEYQNFLENAINDVVNFDELLESKKEDVLTSFNKLMMEANNLSEYRKDIAKKITKEIEETLVELVIKNAKFRIDIEQSNPKNEFDYTSFKKAGLDTVEFMISTNKGEPLKPLAKTASGGEMSRVMLAFKTIFARSQNLPTIIFDEIDTGISGFIAKQIARKISDLSKITQVVSITHIPQVVAQGSYHLAVTKEIKNNSTQIKVKYLNHDERVIEIAKMVSGDTVTEAAKDIARELLLNP
ncbi:MAG: DNA repair protein RecN [Candidatus Izemoplasmatales bacterium]|nr:DNA repair protein RecN [Candidatus Izemoplasmatales bacterium]MDD4069364.1 DNA repair protein RecN [Candidatus Izemoplasmatales bacterium]